MKAIIFILIFIGCMIINVFASDSTEIIIHEDIPIIEEDEIVTHEEDITGSDDIYIIEDSIEMDEAINNEEDSVNIKIKNKTITIKEDEVSITDEKNNKQYSYGKRKKRSREDFKGHLQTFNIGLPNYLDADFQMIRTMDEQYLDLNTSKSYRLDFIPATQDFGIITKRIGLTTGVGFEFTQYHFDNNNSITKNEASGLVEELNYTVQGIDLKKSKLSTGFLNVPVLLEIQPFNRKSYVAAGVVGAIKILSYTKVVYSEGGEKRKESDHGDFNISPLRFGYTVRMGYDDFGIYGIYYPVSFFEKDRGPELYPFSVGISFSID